MIRMNNFALEPAVLHGEMLEAVERVLASGHYVLGKEVTSFEESWAQRCGVSTCVGVANGLDAIELGIRALGIGPGDEVITTSMTAVATVLAIHRAGAVPVLADIDSETGLLDIESVERCISRKTRALLVVHLYGQMKGVINWQEFCRSHSIFLIEDCAQAHDASENGQIAGSVGEFGGYSFYPTKNLGAVGDAGAVVTNNAEIVEQIQMMRNYGQSTRYVHDVLGMNSRLDEVQAAILSTRLPYLETFTNRRQEIAKKYFSGITNPFVSLLAPPEHHDNHVYHLFVLRTRKRREFQEYLKSRKIETLIHYPVPVHKQKPFSSLKIDPVGLVATESHADMCVSIPCGPHLTDSEVEKVIDVINEMQL